jgi:CubicO group peptidase (beta-lactamase class C family)
MRNLGNPHLDGDKITVHHLLTTTSGIPNSEVSLND